MQFLFQNFIRLFRPKLNKEELLAYFDRLPEAIQVSWLRDGKFIIGTVMFGKEKFTTQGRSADEFIDTVNDALLAVHDIPKEYFDILAVKKFTPNADEYKALNNVAMKNREDVHFLLAEQRKPAMA